MGRSGARVTRNLDAPWVFVDPGVHASGVAVFRARELVHAEYRADPLQSESTVAWRCVCEKPQVYNTGEARKGDLIDLAIAAGRMTSALPTEYITPAQWKGSAKKGPMHERMFGLLSPEERELLARSLDGVRKTLHHNVFDAVCMGLKWLGRWK